MISKTKILKRDFKIFLKYFVQGFIKYLDQGWQTFSVKGQMINIFSQVNIASSQFCHCESTAIDDT